MKWLSINEVKLGIKQKIYEFENLNNKNLIYNAKTKEYVGHLENQTFHQDKQYTPSKIEIDLYGEYKEKKSSKFNLF